jgi:hypothetical protein
LNMRIEEPSLLDIQGQIQGESSNPPTQFTDSENQAAAEKIELDGRKQFHNLRGRWSTWLITWISGLLIFHICLTGGIGFGWLDFKNYLTFLPMVVVENFLQIAGMGIVIVKFLYPPKSKSSR